MFICIAFASLKYLWDLQKTDENGVCSTSYMAAHVNVRPQGRVMDRGTVELYLVRPLLASQSSTRRLAMDFWMFL